MKCILPVMVLLLLVACPIVGASVNPPSAPVRLVFIHHSCGSDWLSDGNGGLGLALMGKGTATDLLNEIAADKANWKFEKWQPS